MASSNEQHIGEVAHGSSENKQSEAKADTHHVEQGAIDGEEDVYGFTANLDTIPKGYYGSVAFMGTLVATGLGFASGISAFALTAPNSLGPDKNYIWIALVYTLVLSVGLLLVGRLSDLFGRRWFFIGGQALGMIGCIVCATAQNINTVIVGMAIVSLGASSQQSIYVVINELVPMKYRFLSNLWITLWTFPLTAFGAAISQSFNLHTSAGWRGPFYILIGTNAASFLLFYLFYFPPTYDMKSNNKSKLQQLKDFDFVGLFLYVVGMLLFVLALSWGGAIYPWKSAATISCLIIGFICLVVFGFWESVRDLKAPVLPAHLFRRFSWVASVITLSSAATVYYAMAVLWPQMVAVVYTNYVGFGIKQSLFASLVGIFVNVGQLSAYFLSPLIGKAKLQVIFAMACTTSFIAAMASCGVDTFVRACVFLVLATFSVGWVEGVCITLVSIDIANQQELGTAMGAGLSSRTSLSAIASAVYLTVLGNRLSDTIPSLVPPALISAGLPAASVPVFLSKIATGNLTGVEGLTPDIAAIGIGAYQEASVRAYSTVFLTTIAFGGLAMCLAFFVPSVDDRMTGEIAATLHNRVDKNIVGANVEKHSDGSS